VLSAVLKRKDSILTHRSAFDQAYVFRPRRVTGLEIRRISRNPAPKVRGSASAVYRVRFNWISVASGLRPRRQCSCPHVGHLQACGGDRPEALSGETSADRAAVFFLPGNARRRDAPAASVPISALRLHCCSKMSGNAVRGDDDPPDLTQRLLRLPPPSEEVARIPLLGLSLSRFGFRAGVRQQPNTQPRARFSPDRAPKYYRRYRYRHLFQLSNNRGVMDIPLPPAHPELVNIAATGALLAGSQRRRCAGERNRRPDRIASAGKNVVAPPLIVPGTNCVQRRSGRSICLSP